MPVFMRSARTSAPAYLGRFSGVKSSCAPLRCTVPLSGSSSRLMQRSNVVLPEPEGPISTVVLCSSTSSDTPLST